MLRYGHPSNLLRNQQRRALSEAGRAVGYITTEDPPPTKTMELFNQAAASEAFTHKRM
jgi:hypothetical protein